MPRQYQLHEKFTKFTGLLNGIYPCKDGVVTIPDGPKEPKVLIDHYGAKEIKPKVVEMSPTPPVGDKK